MLWTVAKRVERALGAHAQKKIKNSGVAFTWQDPHSEFSADALDKYIAQYICNGCEVLREHSVFTMATDKAWCNGLPPQNSVICVPGGQAVLCPPSVPFAE